MRFLHLADLHFGKSIYGTSMLENGDQGFWAARFLELAEKLRPDAVVIAGDVYDRSAPSGEAVSLLSRMLTGLSALEIPVMLTAGNHDSAQRLDFLSGPLAREGVYISAPLCDSPRLRRVTLEDEYGPVTFWLMPYVYPALIARALGEDSFREAESAVRALLERQDADFSQRNVLIAHQNVTAGGFEGLRGGSESMVGGVGQIDYTAFDGFDYVALGHIHAAYPVGRETVRYAGSPLPYHFNETRQPKKGPLLVELSEKGAPVKVETLTIEPLHPMRELRGEYEALRGELLADPREGEYLRIVLTDRRVSPEISAFLHELCDSRGSVLMELASDYAQFPGAGRALSRGDVEQKSVDALFCDFYTERSGGVSPDDKDLALLGHAAGLMERSDPRAVPTADEIESLLAFLTEQEAKP